MPRLPISGWQVTVRQPTGIEDLFLQESPGLDVAVALHLLNRLVQFPPVSTANWKQLSVPDYEALLLLLRRVTLGDMVRAETKCMAAGCGVTADVAFRIGDYLASQTPRMPRGVERLAESDTFRIAKLRRPSGLEHGSGRRTRTDAAVRDFRGDAAANAASD
jgi:hypothetical protein